MIRIKKVILYLCMVALLVSNISITAFASDLNDGVNDGFDRYMGGTNIQGFNSWDITDKKSLFATNIVSFFSSIGMYFRNGSGGNLMDIFTTHLIESDRIENADNLDEYIASHLTANTDETELYMSSDLTNALHETAVQYIEEETGYFVIPTLSAKDLPPENFYNKATYDLYKNYISGLGSDICIVSGLWHTGGGSSTTLYQLINGQEKTSGISAYVFYRLKNDYGIIDNKIEYKNGIPYIYDYSVYTSDWIAFAQSEYIVDGLTWNQQEPFFTTKYRYNAEENDYYVYVDNRSNPFYGGGYTQFTQYGSRSLFTSDGRSIRVYKTLEDFKNYSVGTRPYYITDAFKNYDSTVDNSTTITQTEIDNSVTYGDVYNYITNNYDNPDGLSEDELRAILAEYLSQINNNNSGSGSGSGGDSGSSGGGLSGFLSGLGTLGDAILGILGKLIEYVGKAIDLIVNGISGIIEKIPQSITGLMTAAFPFLPEEFFTAIELALILGVVCIVIKIFK